MNITPLSSPGSENSVGSLHPKKTDSAGKIAQAAGQFEALLIQQMLQSAHASGEPEDGESSTMTDLAQQQFAQALATRGGLGIAKMVVQGLNQNAHR